MYKKEDIKKELIFINHHFDYSPKITGGMKNHIVTNGFVFYEGGAVILSVSGEKFLGVFDKQADQFGDEISSQDDISECFFYLDGDYEC